MRNLHESKPDSLWLDELTELKASVEALLFVSTSPLSLERIAEACEMPLDTTKEAVESLVLEYDEPGRGMHVHYVDGGYLFLTRPEYDEAIRRLRDDDDRRLPNLSRAALEVLAVVAYKQPVTRAEIDSIRGVSSDSALRTLIERGLVEEAGKKEVIGRPTLFATTSLFLQKFGLGSLEELPVLEKEAEPE